MPVLYIVRRFQPRLHIIDNRDAKKFNPCVEKIQNFSHLLSVGCTATFHGGIVGITHIAGVSESIVECEC